jgi:4-amino-4-deoxy-L-arabinose transferase-like glycosyltransferase
MLTPLPGSGLSEARAGLRRGGVVDHLIGAALAVIYLVILVKTAHGIGYARDEGFYFRAASAYSDWFDQLSHDLNATTSQAAVDAAWSNNHEHPALVKSLFGISWNLFYKKLHLFAEEGTSYRFGGMCFAAGALWLIYVWGARARSRSAGLVAALLFAMMPRVFYHAHLDCFDVPISCMWALCAYVYWRSLQTETLAWAVATGVMFGLALDTKHNSWFLPIALSLHALIARRERIWRGLKYGEIRAPLALWAMASIGPFVFLALWPWIWFDTVDRVTAYVNFHRNHEYYNMIFLGVNYWKPPMPRAYVWVMTAATVPAITLLLFLVGVASRARAHLAPLFSRNADPPPYDPAYTDSLWAICLLIQLAPWILSTDTPIFGETKHWLTAYPFLCLFAGVGFDVALAKMRTLVGGKLSRPLLVAAEAAMGVAVLAAPFAETMHSHPWGLSNYTPLVGGAPGGASLGLNRQFWGFTTGAVTGWLNDHVSPGQSVFLHDTAFESWDMLHHDGRLLPKVQAAWTIPSSAVALYHHEEHMEGVEYQIWSVYGTSRPALIGTYDGVPVIYVYANPGQMHAEQ